MSAIEKYTEKFLRTFLILKSAQLKEHISIFYDIYIAQVSCNMT